MNISAASSLTASSHYAALTQASQVGKPQPQVSQSVDSDGDHDGSTAVAGRLDVKA